MVLPSYRNQSIHLPSKSMDWLLYEGNNGIYWFKLNTDTAHLFGIEF